MNFIASVIDWPSASVDLRAPVNFNLLTPPEALSELAVDQVVLGQRYRLERLVGVGSTGPVWLAVDLELQVSRALKFLSELAQDELEDLKAETLRCQELTHQGIVRIYDFVRDDHHAAICMEAIDGPDLRAAQRERTPPCFHPDELVFWMEGLCRALHHAHTFAKIIHRDLKPSNLLINGQGYLKVADFGIAKAIPKRLVRQDSDTRIAGTLEYVSPQQLEGNAPSVADDIYSFGATLFELLAGQPPFGGDDLYDQVLQREAPSVAEVRHALDASLPSVSKDWEETIQACLAKDPSERPESIRQVADLLGLELQQMTIREPVLPEGFLKAVGDDEGAGPLTGGDRRVRTLQDLPLGSAKRKPWSWVAGAGAVALILGVAFCRPSSEEAPEKELAALPLEEDPRKPVVAPPAEVRQVARAVLDMAPVNGALRAEDWDTAAPLIEKMKEAGHGRHPSVLLSEAKLYHGKQAYGRALETLRALLDEVPTHPEGTRLKVVVHAALGEWQAVGPAATWAIAQPDNGPMVGEMLVLRGRANRKLGHLDPAIADFNQAVTANSMDANIYYERGLTYREEGSLQQAINDFTTAIRYEPQHLQARAARGRSLLQSGQLEQSTPIIIEDLSHLIRIDPGDMDARLDRMRCYFEMKNWEGVVTDSKVLLEKKPDWEEVKELFAIARVGIGKGVSLQDLRIYTKRYPNDLYQWYKLAEKCLSMGLFEEAKKAFSEIIRQDPNATDAHEGRAFAFYSVAQQLKDSDKQPELRHAQRFLGIQDINTFLERAPERATHDSYLLKTKLHFYRGDYPQASATAFDGLKRFPAARDEFEEWIDEIKVASGLEKKRGKSGKGRPDRANWWQRFKSRMISDR